jgi:hypothetical protein
VQADADKYRAEAEKAIRDRLKKMPNDALRAAVVEYNIRHKAISESLKKYEEELKEAKSRLAALQPGQPSEKNSPGGDLIVFKLKYARASNVNLNLEEYFQDERVKPKHDSANSRKLRFIWDPDSNTIVVQNATDEQMATIRNLIEVYDQPKEVGRTQTDELAAIREKLEQMRNLFEPSADNPTKRITYNGEKLPAVYDDHWHYLIKGLEQHSDKRPFTFNWHRLRDKRYEIEAPIRAHKQIFEPLFSGSDIFGTAATTPAYPVDGKALGQWRDDLDDSRTDAQKSRKPLLVYFYSKSSSPCQAFERDVLQVKDVQAFIQEKFIPVRIDVDASPSIAGNFRIQQVPKIVVATEQGEGTAWLSPNKPPFFLAALTESLAQLHASEGEPPSEAKPSPDRSPWFYTPKKAESSQPANAKDLAAKYPQYYYSGPKEKKAAAEPLYLYDGKTFDYWRDLWKNELKTKRRMEAVTALAAFARAGQGKEAAETIFDVAGQYNFLTVGSDTPEGQLKMRVLDVLVNDETHVPEVEWLPVLHERLRSDPKKWKWLAYNLLARVMTTDDSVKQELHKFEDFNDSVIRNAAEKALRWVPHPVQSYLDRDKNGDGKLTKDEIPDGHLQAVLTADADKDGAVSKAELINGISGIQDRLREAQPGEGGGFF